MITATETRAITVAHSPDSDDAFMFYGLATNKIETGDLRFEHVLEDIQTLNEKATRGVYDVTAISFHAYAYVNDKYALLPHGASIGEGYGPILVARDPRYRAARGRVFFTIRQDALHTRVSLPLDNLPGFKGRWFNGAAGLDVGPRRGRAGRPARRAAAVRAAGRARVRHAAHDPEGGWVRSC